MKKTSIIVLLALISIFCAGIVNAFALEGHSSVTTTNHANKLLAYYYYVPDKILKSNDQAYPLLVMVPGLSGKGEGLVGKEVKKFAEQEGFIVIAPSFVFDEQDWQAEKSYQYPSVWSGEALLKIVQQFQMTHRLRISRFYLFGHSAGAQFVLRFAIWKPELCVACAAHASGALIQPQRSSGVNFFVTAGTMDTTRIQNVQTFCETARNLGIEVIYKEYNIGHNLIKQQVTDSLEFFKLCRGTQTRIVNADNRSSGEEGMLAEEYPDEVVVYLKNGRSSRGQLKEDTEHSVTLQMRMGSSWGTITIPRTKIESVQKVDN